MVLFSFLAGVLVGGAATLVVLPLWRGAVAGSRTRRFALAGAFVVVFALTAVLIYLAIGSRHSIVSQVAQAPAAPAAAGMGESAGGGRSMEAEVAKLEARLARDGGSAADWTLLAQAYEVLGRPDDARRARAKIPSTPATSQMGASTLSEVATRLSEGKAAAAPAPAASVADLERRANAAPRDAQNWLALADAQRAQRDFGGARTSLEKVVALKAMTAQSWADYADTLASLNGGSLGGAAGNAIDSALVLDATNTKALWLKASQAHEQRRFGEALTWWKKLRALLPPDSSDARIIDSNIAEDTQLAGGSAGGAAGTAATAAAAATPSPAAVAELSGTVSLDSRLSSRVQANDTLFIYAKAADAPGPPLAVFRTLAGAWPVSFRLDDSMAMIPTRKLSQFDKVVVEARISHTGQAAPSSGDLYVTSAVLNPIAGKKLALVISHEIG
jgi:cytochrome c-type biogenesis protein CcmH